MNKESYTAASTFPTKLLYAKVIKEGKIRPIHIQLSPTNRCNLNCSYCSCSDRQKSLEMTLDDVKDILDILKQRGTEAMTITGGGEPLMHPNINEIIDYALYKGIEIGLVTNGILLGRLERHSNLTWCRISNPDDGEPDYESIKCGLRTNPGTDFAFSYVVTRNPNYGIVGKMIGFSNENNFTHIRLVSDLCDLENVPPMEEVKERITSRATCDDSRVIYQGRKDSTKGTKDCYISLLKPIIGIEGVFPCCGSQYAIQGQPRDMIDKMKMGDVKDLEYILDLQRYFDGSICDVCYYQQYNDALKILLNRPEHLKFV